MRSTKIFCAVILIAVALVAPASAESAGAVSVAIRVGKPVHVSADRIGRPHVEPILAAHPKDPRRLLGAAITFPDWVLGGGVTTGTTSGFVSEDGGATWRRVAFAGCQGDPWVAFGPDGAAYLSCHDQREVGARKRTGIRVFRSADGGRSWESPVAVPLGAGGSVDQPKMVADLSSSGHGGAIYLTVGAWMATSGLAREVFGAVVAHSDDGARSFKEPVLIKHDNLDQQPFGAAALAINLNFGGRPVGAESPCSRNAI